MSYYAIEHGRIYKRNAGLELFFEHPIYTTAVFMIFAGIIALIGGARGWLPYSLLGVGAGVLLLTIAYDILDPFTPQADKDARKEKELAQERKFQQQMQNFKNDPFFNPK